MKGYDLSRRYWNWAFENPEKVKPNLTAIYFFAVEHCNRLGWKSKFGLPSTMAMEATGIKSYNTYKAAFDTLVDEGFLILIERSKNQYSANIVSIYNPDNKNTAVSKNDKALDKALDKAMIKHMSKQSESTIQSTIQSIDSINKPLTNKQINKETKNKNLENQDSVFDLQQKACDIIDHFNKICNHKKKIPVSDHQNLAPILSAFDNGYSFEELIEIANFKNSQVSKGKWESRFMYPKTLYAEDKILKNYNEAFGDITENDVYNKYLKAVSEYPKCKHLTLEEFERLRNLNKRNKFSGRVFRSIKSMHERAKPYESIYELVRLDLDVDR